MLMLMLVWCFLVLWLRELELLFDPVFKGDVNEKSRVQYVRIERAYADFGP